MNIKNVTKKNKFNKFNYNNYLVKKSQSNINNNLLLRIKTVF